MTEQKESKQAIAYRVSGVSIAVNVLLSLGKLLAGIFGNSSAMISDAVHSASDVLSTIVVLLGVKASGKEADKEHPYGHERMECVAAIVLAMLLAVVGLSIGFSGMKKILAGNYGSLAIPGVISLVAAVLSILLKEGMFWYTKLAAKKINSGALMADAWHHRSDALSSIGSFLGILFARLGFPVMDAIASVLICLCILKVAVDIFRDGLNKMVDHSCDKATEEQIRELVVATSGVEAIDDLKTRLFGDKIYVDVEIQVDRTLSLGDAHGIAESVHDKIEMTLPDVKHCMVHVNPTEDTAKTVI